jgi:hypothetical protein
MIAAVVIGEPRGQCHRLDAADPTDEARDRGVREVVRRESRPARKERVAQRDAARADGGGGGVGGDEERLHALRSIA